MEDHRLSEIADTSKLSNQIHNQTENLQREKKFKKKFAVKIMATQLSKILPSSIHHCFNN